MYSYLDPASGRLPMLVHIPVNSPVGRDGGDGGASEAESAASAALARRTCNMEPSNPE